MRSFDSRVLALILVLCPAFTEAQPEPPIAKRVEIVDEYHEEAISDPYRWLETWSDPAVQTWSNAQNAYARSVLDGLPSVDRIRERVTELFDLLPESHGSLAWVGGRLFAMKFEPPLNQPFLVVMPSSEHPDAARTLVDPNALDQQGSISIDWYVPSPDGQLVAVSMSSGGSESGDVHVFDTATGQEVDIVIARVNGGTAGGDLAWVPDGTGFFYTRYPRSGERPDEDMNFYQELWYHRLGTPSSEDRYEIGEGLPRIAEIEVDVDRETGLVLASVQDGDSGRFAYFVRQTDDEWVKIADFEDGIVEAVFGPGGDLFFVSRKGAPRGRVFRNDPADSRASEATLVIDEGSDAIATSFYGAQRMLVTADRIYLTFQLGGPSEIRAFDLEGNPLPGPKIPPVSNIGSRLVPAGGNDFFFSSSSFIEPSAWYRFHGEDGTTSKTALRTEYPVEYPDIEVVRDFAVSKDGTKVPINIIRRKDIELNGMNPTRLTGYGGFGISLSPWFSLLRSIWLDNGGVVAVANLRGGGEYGEEWHRAGMLTEKQNVFDDFYACMRYLVEKGYTTPDKLVIEGGSNGGLLMGAMITQHPEAMRCVVSHVGIYDMLRVELTPNGKFNIPEYGTVEDKEQYRALRDYSPYHRVIDGTSYPAILFLTGANDPRVDPMHSRKMTARLQAANASGHPILLRTSSTTGHGGATPLSDRIEKTVDVLSFIFHELGMEYREMDATP